MGHRVTSADSQTAGSLNPQSYSGVRQLPLPATLVRILKVHREGQQQRWPDGTYVFLSTHGTPIEPRNLLRQFKAILEKAKLPTTIRFHDLRHSCATFLIAQGVHARVIMEILGHAQISTTMNIYGHVLPDTHREATDKLDKLLDTFLRDTEAKREPDKDTDEGADLEANAE